MDKIKKNFGFGCMRLPMKDGEVDTAETCRMVDAFLDAGFNYFDTAHGYLGGKSETALRECLTSRYPREAYVLVNKLSTHHYNSNEEIRPLFESQFEACGVDYFDFYLMHAQDKSIFAKYKACRAYETALELLAEGKTAAYQNVCEDFALKADAEIALLYDFYSISQSTPSLRSFTRIPMAVSSLRILSDVAQSFAALAS